MNSSLAQLGQLLLDQLLLELFELLCLLLELLVKLIVVRFQIGDLLLLHLAIELESLELGVFLDLV